MDTQTESTLALLKLLSEPKNILIDVKRSAFFSLFARCIEVVVIELQKPQVNFVQLSIKHHPNLSPGDGDDFA